MLLIFSAWIRIQSIFFCCSPLDISAILFGTKQPCLAQAMATMPMMSHALDPNIANSIAPASPAIVVPSTAGMIQVHQHEMTTLIERGLHPVVPVNGPNDSPNGQPIYVVPAQPFLWQDAEPT